MIKFPENFLWGAAASAYQVEGGNIHSDWWQWEKDAGKENSGHACRHYEFYEKDFDLAKSLGHNAHRFSIEWGRIEPRRSEFSKEALQHYIDVALSLRTRNIEPIATLHHFTNPTWFADSGGWENKRSVELFLRYCEVVVRALADSVHYWITINEPTIYASHAYIFGAWPPQVKSTLRAKRVYDNLSLAHIKAYRLIHKIYKKSERADPAVGISQYTQAFVPCKLDLKNRFAAYLRDKIFNFNFLDRLAKHKAMDFIGVNYYLRQLVELKRPGVHNLFMDTCENNHHPVKKNSLGWDIYPQGLADILLKLKRYRLPVMITENGICTQDDGLRWEFIHSHLESVHQAMEKGAPVIGYLYWSLMDNFEWDKGFAPRFGLVEIDHDSSKRSVRESAKKLAEVYKTGILK